MQNTIALTHSNKQRSALSDNYLGKDIHFKKAPHLKFRRIQMDLNKQLKKKKYKMKMNTTPFHKKIKN